MTYSKTPVLPAMLGSAALVLSLVLGGCGQAQPAPEAAEETADDQATEDTEQGDDLSVLEDLTAVTDVTRSIVTSTEEPNAEGFDELATTEDKTLELEATEIDEGDGDESKAAAGEAYLMDGGLQLTLPSSWSVDTDSDGLVFESPDGAVIGYMYSTLKDPKRTYDIEGTVKAIPAQIAQQNGLTDVQILGYDTAYSSKGTLVSARVMFMGMYKGSRIVHYAQVVESKSFINAVEFISTYEGFGAHVSEIDAATNSICFMPGETI